MRPVAGDGITSSREATVVAVRLATRKRTVVRTSLALTLAMHAGRARDDEAGEGSRNKCKEEAMLSKGRTWR